MLSSLRTLSEQNLCEVRGIGIVLSHLSSTIMDSFALDLFATHVGYAVGLSIRTVLGE